MDTWLDWDPINFSRHDFDKLLLWCCAKGANDIVLRSNETPYVKLNGEVREIVPTVLRQDNLYLILKQIRNESCPANVLAGQPQDFSYIVEGHERNVVRFRCNATAVKGRFGSTNEISLTLRTFPESPPSVAELEVEEAIVESVSQRDGLILVTGPTASGKSTLCFSLLRHQASTFARNILTLEEPVEYDLSSVPGVLSKIAQTEVPGQVASFSEGVRACMRRAPDTILVGESRDRETFSAAIRAASTGHLVLTTVHANDVASTVQRMVDEFDTADRRGVAATLAAILKCVVHQRLYPRVGGGRIAIREYVVIDHSARIAMRDALRDGTERLHGALHDLVEKSGKFLVDDAAQKYEQELISRETFNDVCLNTGRIDRMLD